MLGVARWIQFLFDRIHHEESQMSTQPSAKSFSRRATLAALAAGGIGTALLPTASLAATVRQDAKDFGDHPFCGSWMTLAMASYEGGPQVPAVSINFADGSTYYEFPLSQRGNDGVQFVSGMAGVWEPHDDRTGHFSNLQFISNADGDLVSIIAVDGFPQVSEDGMTFIDDGHLSTITIRDGEGNVLMVIEPGQISQPITGTRMAPGFFGLPDAATPVAHVAATSRS